MFHVKKSQILILILGCIFVYLLFTFWPWSSKSFTANSKLYYKADNKSKKEKLHDFKRKGDVRESPTAHKEKVTVNNIDVIIIFTKAKDNRNLQDKFEVTVRSMFKWASVPLSLYIIGDENSKELADRIIAGAAGKAKYQVEVVMMALNKYCTHVACHCFYMCGR